jgi:myosin heavy subunit
MLDTIRIRQAGFPVRFSFDTFYSRYKLLSPQAMNAPDARTGCALVLREYGDLMRIGTTKVFMKEVLEGKLADKRNQRLKEMAIKIQLRYRTYPFCSIVIHIFDLRRYKAHQHYKKLRIAAVVFQKVTRSYFAQSSFELKRVASHALGALILGSQQRKQYASMRKSIAVCQLRVRKLIARKKAARIRNAIIKIQASKQEGEEKRGFTNGFLAYRMYRQRRAYKAKRASAILIESSIRGLLARKGTKAELERRMKILAEDESRMPPEEQARRQKLREEEAKKAIN